MRRQFLKQCAAAGMGLALPVALPDIARAEAKEPEPYDGPFYVIFNASGGWDTTYLMDPKGGDINRLYQEGDILSEGNHRLAPIAKHVQDGMSNEDFFKKYGKELLVINGIDYSTNAHSACSRYMATGKLDSLAYPTFAALVAACRNPQSPLAFLTFGNYSATGNLVPMSRVPYLPSLAKLANADGVDGSTRHMYHDDFVRTRIDQALEKQMNARILEQRLPRVERAQSTLYAAQLNSKALERITEHIPKTTPKQRLARQAEIALASFKAGVCVSANLTIGQFDSHGNNDTDQMKLIPEFLAGIDHILRRAEELKIREKLVVVIQSEMGRTPNYNKGNGKDHWSIGSVMFLGHGIQGNRVIGATDQKQYLIPVDPQTLALKKDEGVRIRPQHIHSALRNLAGVGEHEFSKQFPLGVPAKEELVKLWG